MKRDLSTDLVRWKEKQSRMPLLLRGARQVGKSYLVKAFGQAHFRHCEVINFEQNPEYRKCFETLEPVKIVASIELMTGRALIPGESLLFLDEIQECPQAIVALRYFKEQMPELHVIGAGSLLEFALNDADFRMPVGRVQSLFLRPLSFGEYLEASGNSRLREHLNTVQLKEGIQEVIHEKLLLLVKEYAALGGMPAVVSSYLEQKNPLECQEIQTSVLTTFRNDFGKYAKLVEHEHLKTIFAKAPGLVSEWIKYSKLDPETPARILKKALQKLCDAGLITLIYATSGVGLPFVTHMNEKKFKLLFLDIGLVKRACNLDLELLMREDLLLINRGALAEQFVGQELLAYLGKDDMNSLFFWVREEKSSSAEVDYLAAIDSTIVPIEVKAGSIGSLRSLKIFMGEKKSPLGIRISAHSLSYENHVLNVPFYLIEQLPRFVRHLRRK